ncbi:MAG: hypothetical protein KF886_02955 [Candidatus Hydrogenedentes bacterium]|nr:hypothetical protein [Candidatus Hydrogenedentota bacterium]
MEHLAITARQRRRAERLISVVGALVLDEPGAALNFTGRLRREQHGWSAAYARRVVAEYKRFLILAAVSETQVTPSTAVDEAWHLHLVYTRSYHEWCGAIFGAYLHHGPTKGGASEGDRFEAQYDHTLKLYAAVFGTAPPPDIWPPASVRFDPRRQTARVQTSAYWLVPRHAFTRAASIAAVLVCAVAAGVLASHHGLLAIPEASAQSPRERAPERPSDRRSDNSPELHTAEKVVVGLCIAMVAFALVAFLIAAATGNTRKRGDSGGGGCGGWFGCGGGGDGCGASCGGGGCGGGCGG